MQQTMFTLARSSLSIVIQEANFHDLQQNMQAVLYTARLGGRTWAETGRNNLACWLLGYSAANPVSHPENASGEEDVIGSGRGLPRRAYGAPACCAVLVAWTCTGDFEDGVRIEV